MDISLHDVGMLIARTRKCRYIKRFAGQRYLHPGNVAEHSYTTASLFGWMAEALEVAVSSKAFMVVLQHDLLETETGDLLFTAKHGVNDALWEEIEANIVKEAPLLKEFTDASMKESLTVEEWWLLKMSDYLEGWITSQEEVTLGNKSLDVAKAKHTYASAINKHLHKCPESIDQYKVELLLENIGVML